MTAEVLENAGFDFSDVAEQAEPVSGPLPRGSGTPGTSRGTRTTTRGSRAEKRINELQKKLSGEMFTAGGLIGMGLPVTGYYVCQESDAFTKAVTELAQARPEWIEALEKIANVGPGLIVGKTVLGIGAAIGVDRHRIDPEKSRMMKFLGVYKAWRAIEDKKEPGDYSGYTPSAPPAGAFVPVG